MSKQPKKIEDQKPKLFEIPLDATDEELEALAKAIRVSYFGYDPQESPDYVPPEDKKRRSKQPPANLKD